MIIDSIKHPLIVLARELSSGAGRMLHKKVLLLEARIIELARIAGAHFDYVLYAPQEGESPFIAELMQENIPCHAVTEGILKKVSDTSYLVSCIAVASITNINTYGTMGPFALLLDRVLDHGNIGTIMRTAAAFNIYDIVTTHKDFDPYYKKVIEASRAYVFKMKFTLCDSVQEAVAYLRAQNFYIVATSPEAPTIQSQCILPQRPLALVVGNETEGVSPELMNEADMTIQVPMGGLVESLNVGVFTGISLYELKLKHVLTMLTHYIQSAFMRELGVTLHLVRSVFDHHLKKVSPLTSTQLIVLMMLTCDRKESITTLSKEFGTTREHMNKVAEPLIGSGYVTQQQDVLEITVQGEQMLSHLWPIHEVVENKVLQNVTEEERKQVLYVLKKLQDNAQRLL